jgi:hypothetical protein
VIWQGSDEPTPVVIKIIIIVMMILIGVSLGVAYVQPADASDEILIGWNDVSLKGGYMLAAYTYIVVANPSTHSGIVDSVEIRVNQAMTGLQVGTFYEVDGEFALRDSESIGASAVGLHEYTGLDIVCFEGDRLGFYASAGRVDSGSSGGTGAYGKSGNAMQKGIPYTYNAPAAHRLSFRATGDAVALFTGCGIVEFDVAVSDNGLRANWTFEHEGLDVPPVAELRIHYNNEAIGNDTDGMLVYLGDGNESEIWLPVAWGDTAWLSIREYMYGGAAAEWCNGNVTMGCGNETGECALTEADVEALNNTLIIWILAVIALVLTFLSLRVPILFFISGFVWVGLAISSNATWIGIVAGVMALMCLLLFIMSVTKRGRR